LDKSISKTAFCDIFGTKQPRPPALCDRPTPSLDQVIYVTPEVCVEAIDHVGLQPNVVHAKFERLGKNVRSRLAGSLVQTPEQKESTRRGGGGGVKG
jgi:hypothetical protein